MNNNLLKKIVFLGVLTIVSALPLLTKAETVITKFYEEDYSSSISTAMFRSSFNVQKVATQLTAAVDTTISTVSFELKRGTGTASANWYVKIYEGGASPEAGTLIGTSEFVASSGVSNSAFEWIDFTFSTPVSYQNGTTYFFVLDTTALDAPQAFIGANQSLNWEWRYCPGCGGSSWQDKGGEFSIQLWSSDVVYPGEALTSPSYFVWNYPENSTTTATSTFTMDVDYFLDTDYHSSSTYQYIRADFCPLLNDADPITDFLGETDCESFTIATSTTPDTLTNLTYEVALQPNQGNYLGLVYFWNGVEENIECSWWAFWCDDEKIQVLGTASVNFWVSSTTVSFVARPVDEAADNLCDSFIFPGDTICKAMVWLFVPSDQALFKWATLDRQLSEKLPFALFLQVKDELVDATQVDPESFENITVNIPEIGMSNMTIIDFDAIKNSSFFTTIFDELGEIFKIFVWIWFSAYVWHRLLTKTTNG